jgi:hypothetical protein
VSAANYHPPVAVHPDRYGAVKSWRNRLIVVHDSEGGEGATAGKALAGFLTRPGDRPNGSGGMYGSSYAYVSDLDLWAWPCVPHNVVSYSASGANHNGVHVCIPGKAAQTRAQWLEPVSRGYIRTTAAVIVDIAAAEGIPLVRLTVAQVRDGMSGYCSHHDVSLAFGKSTHTDPGPNFPWDVLAADIAAFTAPPVVEVPPVPTEPPSEEDEMKPIHAVYVPSAGVTVPGAKWFVLLADGSVRHATGPDVAYAESVNVPKFPIAGNEHYDQLLGLSKVNELV